jgi:cellobiose-specific phosphotransferase system component IIA
MNKREQILAAGVLALVALYGGNHFYGNYAKALHARQADVEAAQSKLDEANHKLKEGHRAVKQMEAWQQRALPANFDKALSLYKAWLLAKAKDSGLVVSDITLLPTTNNNAAYKAIGYQMVASGSLSSVVSMLYEFYRSPQLHQISRLQLTRPAGAAQLTVSLDVEALSMKGAVATDKLPKGDAKRLKLASADDYKKSLAERDIVTAYAPPRPPTPPRERREATTPPKYDESELAYFSGAVSSGSGWQAWINVRSTGETLRLASGDPVKIGALDGKIESVEERSLVFKTGDKRFRVALGQSLRKGTEIDAKGGPAAEGKTQATPKS